MDRYTVTEITQEIGACLGDVFGNVGVEGEVSGLKVHASGHWYFTLRDASAALSCTMWRSNAERMRRQPREGERLIAYGRVDVYAARGTYALNVQRLEKLGQGELAQRFAELKARLHAEGLFDVEKHVPIPTWPRAIGIATSPTGAALQDLLRVIRQRHAGIPVYLAPCRVQGEGAAQEIARAVQLLDRHGKSGVIVVGRGGGSPEDLFCFNEEIVVRAVAACSTPIVSAVGHEVDWSLCDMAADKRAATPTHAAQMVTPDAGEKRRWLDEQMERLVVAVSRQVLSAKARVFRLRLLHPAERVKRNRVRAAELDGRLKAAMARYASVRQQRLRAAERHLGSLSPVSVLGRGYAIVRGADGIIRDAGALTPGQRLEVRFAVGEAKVDVVG